jgi:hypothetical protein
VYNFWYINASMDTGDFNVSHISDVKKNNTNLI